MPVVVATAFRAPQSGVRRGRGPRAQGGGWAHWRLSRPLTGRRSSATGKAPPPRFLTCIRPDSSLITRAVGERSPLESLKPRPLRLGEASYGAGENLPGKRAAVVSVLSAHSSAACQKAPHQSLPLGYPWLRGPSWVADRATTTIAQLIPRSGSPQRFLSLPQSYVTQGDQAATLPFVSHHLQCPHSPTEDAPVESPIPSIQARGERLALSFAQYSRRLITSRSKPASLGW